MQRSLTLVASLIAAPLAGCLSVPQPDPPDPEVELDERDGWTTDGIATDDVVDEWVSTFGDAQLDALVVEALAYNRDLRGAVARLDAAAATAQIQGADLWPQVGVGLSGARSRNVFVGLPIPGGPASTTFETYGVSLDVAWELDLWGKLRARKQAGVAEFRAAEADLHGARLSLAAQTAKAWYALIEARMQRDLAIATADTFRNNVQIVDDRYQAGLRSALDLRLAKSDSAASDALVEDREARLDSARRQLEILLGRYPEGELAAQVDLPSLPPPVPAGLPSELLARRPDLRAAEERFSAAGLRVHEARTAFLPSVNLTGAAGRVGVGVNDLLENDFSVWSIGGSVLQPLFQGGRLTGNVKLAEAAVRELLAGYQALVLRAFFDVERSLAAERFYLREEQKLQLAKTEAEQAQRIAEEQYRAGLIDVITLLASQRRALDAQGAWISIRRLLLETRVDLHLALGGGFGPTTDESLQAEVESAAPTDAATETPEGAAEEV